MTCIVAVKKNNTIVVGADRQYVYSDSSDGIPNGPMKIWRANGIIVGVAGSGRVTQLLKYNLDIPEQKNIETDTDYIYRTIVDSVKKTLKANGACRESEKVEFISDYTAALFVFKNTIYTLQEDFQVFEHQGPFWAIGAGRSYALGALDALYDSVPSAEELTRIALEVSAKYCVSVREPFDFLESTELHGAPRAC